MALKRTPESPSPAGGPASEAKTRDGVKDILHHLANTVSALKIFPPEHATVIGFIESLAAKLQAFLDEHGKLEIGVEEYAFTLEGSPVYTDEMTIKSLPFFFFKDGLRILYLYQGLDRAELLNFLDLIRTESQKPAGDSDIVTAMWERDFANIQYFAPDDYLETRILEERSESQARHGLPVLPAEFAHEVIEIKVDTSRFSTGKIALTDEDRAAVRKGPPAETVEAPREPAEAPDGGLRGDSEPTGGSPAAAMDGALTETEVRSLEALIRASRTTSAEAEFLDLAVEILFLEDDLDQYSGSLRLLEDFHQERIARGDFASAVLLVHKIKELRDHLAESRPEKAGPLDGFLKRLVSPGVLKAVRELAASGRRFDQAALLDFVGLQGDDSLPLTADIYESLEDPEARDALLDVFRSAAARDPGRLAGLASDERPRFSLAVVDLLAGAGGKGLPFLSAFIGFKNSEVKLAAVAALGRSGGQTANHILLGFLKDADEDVRIRAAMALNPVEEKTRLLQLIREADSKAFGDKSVREKRAVLSFLGRTRNAEALVFLRSRLLKRNLRPSAAATETRLCAAAGLESMGTAEARAALEKGARSWNRAVRETCGQALARLSRSTTGAGGRERA